MLVVPMAAELFTPQAAIKAVGYTDHQRRAGGQKFSS